MAICTTNSPSYVPMAKRKSPAPRKNPLPPYGQRIRVRREAKNWSMDDLANRIGVRKTTIQNWEEGKVKLKHRSPNLVKLADALDAEPTEFLAPDEMPSSGIYKIGGREVVYGSLEKFLRDRGQVLGVTDDTGYLLASMRWRDGDDGCTDQFWAAMLLNAQLAAAARPAKGKVLPLKRPRPK